MATRDFKIRYGLTVSQNATIEGNFTLGGKTVSRLIDSDEVTTIIDSDYIRARQQIGIDTYGITYNFDTSTTAADPGTGNFRFSIDWTTGTPGSSYNAYVSETDNSSTGIGPLLNTLTVSTNTRKALVVLYKKSNPTVNAKFYVTGQTDNGSWRTLDIEYIDRDNWASISNADEVFMTISIIGDTADSSFDSDQIVAIINENVVSGSVDSDVAAIAQLRRDADSDSIRIQEIAISLEQINQLVDSDLKVVADLRNDVTALQTGGVVSQESTFTTFKYKATQGQTTFSGLDRDNQTLSYTAGNINVFINGILINDSDDYTATNGTSVVLLLAADSDDVVVVQKARSAFDSDTILSIWNNNQDILAITRFDYTAIQGQTVFSGADDNSNSLSYTKDKIQVYLNGILLMNTTDYVATNGTSLTLVTAADSDDKLSIIKYLGTQVTGFDSDQIVDIINENASTLPWVEKTSSVSVVAGQKVIVDTSTAVTLTLPSSASLGDEIRIIDGTGNAATNNITVARNGHNIMGAASDLIINLNASGIGLVYYNASRGWILIEN